jgi:predicted membrane-bound mannosyltransferase
MLMTTKTQQTFGTGAILLFAAGLRIFSLGKQSLFLDEAWSWAASRLSFFEMLRLSVSEPHPPLYYLLLKFTLIVLPSSEAGLRLLSTLLSIGSLAVVLVYVGSRWNVETMLYVGVLMSLKPFDIYYAQEARIYILLGFLLVCSYVAPPSPGRSPNVSIPLATNNHPYGLDPCLWNSVCRHINPMPVRLSFPRTPAQARASALP